MSVRIINTHFLLSILTLTVSVWFSPSGVSAERPNILWLFAEDTSPWIGCYGDPINRGQTPNIDSLADDGVLFSRAYVPAPVCSACRSALMGGQNQIRFNAHEHRSSRGPAKLHLPKGMKLLPQLMKENGYFTFNLGKDDYNFVWDQPATYSLQKKNRADIPWETLKNNQPFFGQIQTAGGKNNTTKFPADRKADPAEVTVPPDYPDNQIYREVVAQHYDAIRKDDDFIGTVLQGLKKSGMAENTIVVYCGDHGANNLVRHKQMPTEGGLRVPFIVAGPKRHITGSRVRNDLVNLLDLSATILKWGNVPKPDWYEGQDLFAENFQPHEWVAAAKDRLDHTIDRVRTIRTKRFRYTRNFKTDRIFLQPQYRDKRDYVRNLRELYATGKLSPKLTEIYFGERPAEEFYDVETDPSQVNNLINDPAFAEEIDRHRDLLDAWIKKGDFGAGEESHEELAYQAKGHKWGLAVNPEYEVVRTDSDGDGLSDAWETIQKRDPEDGRLQFAFDCGGWQTEGWQGNGISDNIAGRQGFLDFHLPEGRGSLVRSGLKLNTARNSGHLVIRMRASTPALIHLHADTGTGLHEISQGSYSRVGKDYTDIKLSLRSDAGWKGTATGIQLIFEGKQGTAVEIDSIAVK